MSAQVGVIVPTCDCVDLGEDFLFFFKGGPPGRHAGKSAMPASRLAASLPAQAGSGHHDTSGHAEAAGDPPFRSRGAAAADH
jgi:hypothetical protein